MFLSGAVTIPPFYNLFNVTLKNLSMFNAKSFCHLHSFFAHCFCPIIEFLVLRKQKRNKLSTTTFTTARCKTAFDEVADESMKNPHMKFETKVFKAIINFS